jgi:hypothetical protein
MTRTQESETGLVFNERRQTASVISSMRSPNAIRLTQRITPVQRHLHSMSRRVTPPRPLLRLCHHFLEFLVCAPSPSATMKDFTHPTWVKIVCCAAPKNSRVPSSPCVHPVAGAWFPKAGVYRLCRTARSHPVAEVVEESYTALFLRVSRSCARTRKRP